MESETQAMVPMLALRMEINFGLRAWPWFFYLEKYVIVGYTQTEENEILSKEAYILEDTWETGTIELFKEDMSGDNGTSQPKEKNQAT